MKPFLRIFKIQLFLMIYYYTTFIPITYTHESNCVFSWQWNWKYLVWPPPPPKTLKTKMPFQYAIAYEIFLSIITIIITIITRSVAGFILIYFDIFWSKHVTSLGSTFRNKKGRKQKNTTEYAFHNRFPYFTLFVEKKPCQAIPSIWTLKSHVAVNCHYQYL